MRRRFKPRSRKVVQPRYRVNNGIRVPKVFLIDEEGNKLGEMATPEAISLAREQSLDLVEVSPNANPPVCKIIDYGKLQYQQSKLDRAKKAKQKKVETKGIRFGIRTDSHDLEFKRAQAEKFLKKGNKVKIEIILKGREKAHTDLAKENLGSFLAGIEVPFKFEEEIKRFPGGFNVIVVPE